jgi:murein DD-endopeptidase MepM/ murein hydrolase activator NlpD
MLALAAAACLNEQGEGGGGRVDTVLVTDTIVRVDTVVRTDTIRLPDSLAALDRAGSDGAAPTESIAATVAGDTMVLSAPRTAAAHSGARPAPSAVPVGDVAELRQHRLLVPVAGVRLEELLDTFSEARGGGARVHHALDIPAPRGTPVLSADDGRILKLHTSAGGGLSIYATDPTERFIYYYAHLDSYQRGLAEGQRVRRGDRLGAVGTTGNAPPNVPHLHFAIARTDDVKRWWDGTPLNPRGVLVEAAPAR